MNGQKAPTAPPAARTVPERRWYSSARASASSSPAQPVAHPSATPVTPPPPMPIVGPIEIEEIARLHDETRPAVPEVEDVRSESNALAIREWLAVGVDGRADRALVASLDEPPEVVRDRELDADAESQRLAEEPARLERVRLAVPHVGDPDAEDGAGADGRDRRLGARSAGPDERHARDLPVGPDLERSIAELVASAREEPTVRARVGDALLRGLDGAPPFGVERHLGRRERGRARVASVDGELDGAVRRIDLLDPAVDRLVGPERLRPLQSRVRTRQIAERTGRLRAVPEVVDGERDASIRERLELREGVLDAAPGIARGQHPELLGQPHVLGLERVAIVRRCRVERAERKADDGEPGAHHGPFREGVA